jgi:hypothetical protein
LHLHRESKFKKGVLLRRAPSSITFGSLFILAMKFDRR